MRRREAGLRGALQPGRSPGEIGGDRVAALGEANSHLIAGRRVARLRRCDPVGWWRGYGELSTTGRSGVVLAWALYDFANTMFSFAIVSFAMSLWTIRALGEGTGLLWFTVTASASVLLNALLSPALGAMSDRAGRRTDHGADRDAEAGGDRAQSRPGAGADGGTGQSPLFGAVQPGTACQQKGAGGQQGAMTDKGGDKGAQGGRGGGGKGGSGSGNSKKTGKGG